MSTSRFAVFYTPFQLVRHFEYNSTLSLAECLLRLRDVSEQTQAEGKLRFTFAPSSTNQYTFTLEWLPPIGILPIQASGSAESLPDGSTRFCGQATTNITYLVVILGVFALPLLLAGYGLQEGLALGIGLVVVAGLVWQWVGNLQAVNRLRQLIALTIESQKVG